MSWAADGSAAFGEHRLRRDEIITVQPPATPGIGGVFLRAGVLLQDERYLAAARAAGDALIGGQLESGGFPHDFYPAERLETRGTFDDEVTQGATVFLLELWQHLEEPRFKEAAQRAADFMLKSQYPNGGFPQAYPLREGHFSSYITLNDQAMMDVIRTLLVCAEQCRSEIL